MDEQQNNGQEEVQDSKLKQAAGNVTKQVAHEAERQAVNKAKEVIAKAIKDAIAKVISVLGLKGLLILAILAIFVIGIVAIEDLLDVETSQSIDEVINMNEYCTIDENGVRFDKDKFIATLPRILKEEIGVDFNDLGLGTVMTDPTGYFFLNPDSQAAKYLYRYMAASLSSQLPYIEGSDEETKGIIRIKRKKSDITVEAENTKGYIFVGESHVHKLEEALTENDIFLENPSTYVSNSINSKSGEYKYEYGTSGNGTGGNLFFIHTLYDGSEPEYSTSVSNMTQEAFPDWIYNGDGTSNGVRTYQGTATAFERIKKIMSNNTNIENWNIVVMQGYSSALLGQGVWDSYLNNLNSMKSELSKLGGNLYVSSTPHSNAGIWQQDTCYSYGKDSIINNLQGPDSNDNNAIYDQYNQYTQNGFSNFINVTSSSNTNSRGKDGNEYKKYENKLDSTFCFDNYAHIDLNHYDSSTMYAWGEYIINVLDGNVSYTPPTSGNTNVVQHKTIDTSSYGLSAEEVKITMDNIKNEYKIAWVSDLHMMHPDQPVINTAWYNRQGITFEQRNSVFNNSYLILDNIINCLKGNDFDAIVFGGDIMDNYSDKNLEYLKRRIEGLSGKKVMFLVADHDYLTEMTTNTGVNKAASSIGVSGDIKKITIGKDGDSINLVGQNYSNEQISDSNVSTINSYLNETNNSLFFTHVPVESKTQASSMQEWSKNNHNGQVYYWSKEASSSGYNNPSENYLNTLYNSSSLRGVFAGHVHSSGDFELNTGIKEHIFKASFNNSIGVITITPSGAGNGSTNQGNINNIGQGNTNQNSNNTEEIELKYIGYQKFQDMINSDNRKVKEESLKYFSLDESWNLCITKWNKESKNDVETLYEVSEVKIPYKNMISGYTVPFIFLIDLQLVAQNANYVDAVANLMKNESYIDLTIFDSVTTDETTYTYEATKHTKTKHVEFDPVTMTSYETGYYDESTSQEGPDVTVTKVETDSVKASVTKAKTWIIDQTITYNLQQDKEYPYEEEGNGRTKTETKSESEPSGEGTWRDPIKETWYEEITKNEWVKGNTETKFMPSEFLGLWKNNAGKYVQGALYVTTKNGGKIVEYNILDGSSKEAPVTNIIPSREQLYDLLSANQTTQIHSEMMEEIINFYLTGEELTGSLTPKFDDIYDPKEFDDANWSDLGTGFWWPLDEIYTTITSKFGYRGDIGVSGASTYHKGIDISVPQGKNVYASADGTVEVSTNSTTAGLFIKINHDNGIKTVYMHNSKLLVKVGQKVKQGDVIAYSGNTGVSGGPHLHFGVEVNGEYVDPLTYVDPNNSRPSGSIGGGTQPDVPANVEAWRPYIEKAFKELGYVMTEEKVEAILRQINTESHGNQNIMQGIKDSNSGKPITIGNGTCPWCPSPTGSSCKNTNIGHGLLQFIPTTFYGNMISGHQNIYNGYDQICTCIVMLEKRPHPYTHYIGKGTGWG